MTIRENFNRDKSSWFRDAAQKEQVRDVVMYRLADDTFQEECRFLMRLWWHFEMSYPEVSYAELKRYTSVQKMNILEELFDAIDSSFQEIDDWVEKYTHQLPLLKENPGGAIS